MQQYDDGNIAYAEMAKAQDAPPIWGALERLENQIGEVGTQTDRMRKKLDPLIRTAPPEHTPNGDTKLQSPGPGSSSLYSRVQNMGDRLEEIGRNVCRWCNELEV